MKKEKKRKEKEYDKLDFKHNQGHELLTFLFSR